MAFRFRKSVKIAPGIRLNISKSGVSTSIGRRGATVNVSKRGTRVTAGIPGSGLSVSHLHKQRTKTAPRPTGPYGWSAALFLGSIAFGFIASASDGAAQIGFAAASVICFIWFSVLLKRSPESSASLNTSNAAKPVDIDPQPTTTWQERVSAIERARLDDTEQSDQSALLSGEQTFVDHLGSAAVARQKAKEAEKNGDFDTAWHHFHNEKHHLMQHASARDFSLKQTLSLDASVHERMANVLRKQKRHNEAFIEIVYWVAAQRQRPIKRHNEKFRTYYHRADQMNVSLEDAWSIVMTAPTLDLVRCRSMVQQWLKPPQDQN